MPNRLCCLTVLCLLFLLVSFGDSRATSQPESPVSAKSSISQSDSSNIKSPSDSLKSILALDPDWRPQAASPFMEKKDRFELGVKIGAAQSIRFPKVLDAKTPIVIHTRGEAVKQYLVSKDTYKAELAGKYLVYRGTKNAILYRYEMDKKSLREFVYIKKPSDLPENGEVIQWRFEGADLELREDGSVALTRTVDIKAEVRKISSNTMADRISHFLAERYGKQASTDPQTKTLFNIPRPVYIDSNGKNGSDGIHYRVTGNHFALLLKPSEKTTFPLWADPTLTADLDSDLILNGQGTSDVLGSSVASAGDFNGDGLDDVIIGARLDNPNGTFSGSAFIFFGGPTVTGTISDPDMNADVVLNGQGAFHQFGESVASAGDFNGDNFDDVIVGASREFNEGQSFGRAFIFFGCDPILDPDCLTVRNADADADVVLNGQGLGDNFGESVASAGDFNDDGKDDVIVGARFDDNNGIFNSGSAFIFFGRSPVGQLTLIADSGADVVLNGQGVSDLLGASVASAGDFNGDGVDDVIVGASNDANSSGDRSGRAFIFFGRSPVGQLTLIADSGADVVLNGQGLGDLFGVSVASAGDFNGDGKDDVIVGAIFDANNGGASGSAFVFFGCDPDVPDPDCLTVRNADDDADVVLNGQGGGDEFGESVASAGDFNDDGKDDVIVGALRDDNNGLNDSGSAFIFFGSATPVSPVDADSADVVLNGQGVSDFFGASVASAGDFNGDGVDDVIVGAVRVANNMLVNSGSAYIFFSSFLFEPQTLLELLIAQVEGINLANGISNALDGKLDAAKKAFSDANLNNDVASVNALQAFINNVIAQAGNKIPQADADALIADAQAIIDLIISEG